VNRAMNRSFAPCVPYLEFLAYADEMRRIKLSFVNPRAARRFRVPTRAGCEWRALPLSTNRKTVGAYLLKEAFQQLWDYSLPARAGKFLDEWCQQTMRSRIPGPRPPELNTRFS
jgi:hypothetical protein